MKEAAGEANMTVITIVLIGVVAAAGAILIPRVLTGSAKKAACAERGGNLSGNTCTFKEYTTSVEGVEKTCNVSKCKSGAWVCASTDSEKISMCK